MAVRICDQLTRLIDLILICCVVCYALISIGCANTDTPVEPRTIPQIDTAHVQAVTAALKTDGELAGEQIRVSAKGDIVVLEGTVQTADEKERADKLAHGIKGINKVENNITVLPSKQ